MEYQPTVLVVDDQESGRFVLEGLLATQGYNVAMATNGREALEYIAASPPDAVLLDVMMPGMNGYEVCRLLRLDPQTAALPIIMVTALDDRESRLKGLKVGADEFISKPFDRLELRTRLETIIQLNRYRRLNFEREKFEWAIKQAEEGYIVIDEAEQVRYANPRGCIYLGLPENVEPENAGSFSELTSAYLRQPAVAWENWPNASEAGPRYLVKPETDHAQVFWLQVDVLHGVAGPDEHRVVRLRNVTEQVDQARERRSFQALIAHKLRTPLIGMRTGLEFLAEAMAELSPQEATELIRAALNSTRRLHQDIESIIKFTQRPDPNTGGVSECSLAQVETMAAAICQELALEPASISIADELAAATLAISEPDTELILRELLTNAKKFHPTNTPAVEIVAQPASAGVISLTVSDDGITLSPEQLEQALTPYVQGEKYFTGQVPGLGLGLSVVASLVWGAGGDCFMRNRPNGPGVMVELRLPVQS